jgi:ABC-2 type transport system permease protein
LSRILFIVQKEFRQIRRTRAYFAQIFVAPFIMLLVLGSAITNEVKHVTLAVLDRDRSPSSRRIVDACAASPSFSFLGMVDSEAQAAKLLDEGTVKIVLVIPPHFERNAKNGEVPAVQVLVDGVDGNSAGVGLGYMTALLGQLQQEWASGRLPAVLQPASPLGAGAGQTPGASPPGGRIALVSRMWYNPNLDSKPNFVPGLIGILLVMITTFLTAINIVREKEMGTLEQLMVTPLGGLQLIIGKIIPFTILGFAQLTVGVAAAWLVFGLWMKGSLLLFYGMAGIFCLSTLGLGIFISTLVRTQQQAMFVAWFIMIFAQLLSGFFVPIENMPVFIQYITYLNPLRYFMTVLREIYLKGSGFRFIWRQAAAMGAIGLITLVAASLRFQKRVK